MSYAPSAEATYRSVLSIKNFRLLVFGTATSETGDWLYNIALLVYIFDATGSAAWSARPPSAGCCPTRCCRRSAACSRTASSGSG